MKTTPSHPYFPRDLSLPNYVPNITPMPELLGIFFGLLGLVICVVWVVLGKKRFPTNKRLAISWFVACGCIHMILEGYFSVNHATLVSESTYLGQMWKEYGKADSRYLTSDTFVWCMETITAFIVGPLCFVTAWMHFIKCPYRYVFQLLSCLCQLYGDCLYFMTEIKEGFKHGEMWHPLTFWFYFVFLNLWWIVVPLILIRQAALRLGETQKDSYVNTKTKKK